MSIAEPVAHVEIQEWEAPVYKRLLTAADLAALPHELPSGPVRFELHSGELIVLLPFHEDTRAKVLARAAGVLGWMGDFAGYGEVRAGDGGIELQTGPDTVVGADAAFLTNDQLPPEITSEGWLITIPALVVEVVSKNDTRREVQQKVNRYLEAGVRLVWVIDPRPRTVTVHRKGESPVVLTEGDNLTAPGIIPELTFPIRRLFD